MVDSDGVELKVGDTVVAARLCGRSSVYVRKGVITRMTKHRFAIDGGGSSNVPGNCIKVQPDAE